MSKIFIANISAKGVAHLLQDTGRSGTVQEGYGFGDWGVEQTSIVECNPWDVEDYLRVLAKALPDEEAAFVVIKPGKPGGNVSLEQYREEA